MAEEFARDITRQAVARACLGLGVNTASPEVIDCLGDVTKHFIELVARSSLDSAEMAGRVQPGIQDCISVLSSSKYKDSRWQDLREFACPSNGEQGWNQPFPHAVSFFPEQTKKSKSSGKNYSLSVHGDPSIPAHLPPFPPSHTYKQKVKGKRKADAVIEESNDKSKKVHSSTSIRDTLAKIENSVQ